MTLWPESCNGLGAEIVIPPHLKFIAKDTDDVIKLPPVAPISKVAVSVPAV